MKARSGDWLIVEAPVLEASRRQGLITDVVGADGAPPYRVHWLDTGHYALVYPGPDAHVETPEQHRVRAREATHPALHPDGAG